MSYDEKCYELAQYFYPHATPNDLMAIAQRLQDVIDDEKPEEDEDGDVVSS